MNVLCPSCQSALPVNEHNLMVHCAACGFESDLSAIGTSPGLSPLPLVRDRTGETLGDYTLLERIGMGGMGVVYRGTRHVEEHGDGNSGSPREIVAIKVLNAEQAWDREAYVARFQREIKALSSLDHPCIVRILDHGSTPEGDHFFVMPFVKGQSLAHKLRSERLSAGLCVAIMRDVADAIAYAHEQGVIHRDIKPANIMLSPEGPEVLDFGLATSTNANDMSWTTLTRSDLVMGTLNYLSPEQRIPGSDLDERSDIFSIGVVFYEMLTGRVPVGRFQPPSTLLEDDDDAPDVDAWVKKGIDRIVLRCLESEPDERYPNARELIRDLNALDHKPPSRKRTWIAAAAAALLIGGTSAAVVPLMMDDETPQEEAVVEQQQEPLQEPGPLLDSNALPQQPLPPEALNNNAKDNNVAAQGTKLPEQKNLRALQQGKAPQDVQSQNIDAGVLEDALLQNAPDQAIDPKAGATSTPANTKLPEHIKAEPKNVSQNKKETPQKKGAKKKKKRVSKKKGVSKGQSKKSLASSKKKKALQLDEPLTEPKKAP